MTPASPHLGPIGRALAAWVDRVARHAAWIVLAWGLVTLLLAARVVPRLGVDTDTAEMLSERLPWRQTYTRYKETFPQYVDQLLVVVEGATPDLADEGRRKLAAAMREEPALFPSVYVPGGGPFFESRALLYLSPEELRETAENLEELGPWARRLEEDPSLAGFLATLDGMVTSVRRGETELDLAPFLGALAPAFRAPLEWRFHQISWQELLSGRPATRTERRAFLLVQPHLEFRNLLPAREAIARVRGLVRELHLTPERGVRVRLSGSVAMEHEELESVMRGMGTAGVLALLLVVAVLFLGLRSWRLVLATAATLLAGLVWTAAFAAVAVGHLNLISVAFAVLYIGLGVDYAIHLCLRYRELTAEGASHLPALRRAAGDVGSSIAISALTTAACFYAFVPTDFTGVSELGLISGTGMFISLLATLSLLPALLSLLHPPGDSAGRKGALSGARPGHPGGLLGLLIPRQELEKAVRRLTVAVTEVPGRWPRAVLSGSAVLAIGCLALLPRLRFDHNPLNLRDPSTESVSAYRELLADSTASPLVITVLEADPTAAEATAARVSRLDVTAEALTVESFVPGEQEEKRALVRRIAAALGPVAVPGRSVAPTMPGATHPGPSGVPRREPRVTDAARDAGEPGGAITAVERLLGSLARFRAFAGPEAGGAARYLGFQIRAWLTRARAASPEARAALVAELERSLVGSLPGRFAALRRSLQPGPATLAELPSELRERWVSPDGVYRVEVRPAEDVSATPQLRRFVEEVRSVAPTATGSPVLELEAGDAVVRAFRFALVAAVVATVAVLLVVLRRFRDALLVLVPLVLAGLLTAGAAVLLGQPLNFANVIALPLLLGVGVDNGIHMVHRARAAPPRHGALLRTSTARAIIFASLTTVLSFGNLALSGHPGTASMGRLLTLGMVAVLGCSLLVLPACLPVGRPKRR
ncbi:MAG: MMPL family transporter [Gemmatimonadota bacterium]